MNGTMPLFGQPLEGALAPVLPASADDVETLPLYGGTPGRCATCGRATPASAGSLCGRCHRAGHAAGSLF